MGALTWEVMESRDLPNEWRKVSYLGDGRWRVTSKHDNSWDYFEKTEVVARVGSSIC